MVRLLILAAFALAGLASFQQAGPSGQTTFRSGVEVVHIDVLVTDKKQRALRGLKAADFVVLQDGRPRPVVSFEDLSTGQKATAPRGGSVRAVSNDAAIPLSVGILFDRTIAPGGPAATARRFAAATVDQLADGDWVSVADLVNRQALPFSRDRAAVALAIGHAATTPMNTTEENATERSECFCGVCTLDLLSRIATAQGEMPNTRRLILYVGASIGTVADNGSACEPYLRPARDAMFRAAQDAGVTIHAIDPNALEAFSPAAGDRVSGKQIASGVRSQVAASRANDVRQNSLRELSSRTGGQAILNTNAPDAVIPTLLGGAGARYRLGFEADTTSPGTAPYQTLAVTVRRTGALVAARMGYFPPVQNAAPASDSAASAIRVAAEPASETDGSLRPLLQAVASYLDQYERALSAVVAEEQYIQIATPGRTTVTVGSLRALPPMVSPASRVRRLRSDVSLVPDPEAGWLGFRDVFEVDGVAVRDRSQRVRDLFLAPDPDARAKAERLVAANARYNVELDQVKVPRTINLPFVGLKFLRGSNQSRSQFRINAEQTATAEYVNTIAIDFREVGKGRLISTPDAAAAHGTVWVDRDSGRIQKTEVVVPTGMTVATITVSYVEAPKLSLWVPFAMREMYVVQDAGTIEGRADYSNFRQFTVTTDTIIR